MWGTCILGGDFKSKFSCIPIHFYTGSTIPSGSTSANYTATFRNIQRKTAADTEEGESTTLITRFPFPADLFESFPCKFNRHKFILTEEDWNHWNLVLYWLWVLNSKCTWGGKTYSTATSKTPSTAALKVWTSSLTAHDRSSIRADQTHIIIQITSNPEKETLFEILTLFIPGADSEVRSSSSASHRICIFFSGWYLLSWEILKSLLFQSSASTSEDLWETHDFSKELTSVAQPR